jgi:opacity protein-like surface antigen
MEKVKMIRFSAAIIFVMSLTGLLGFAQEAAPKVQVFGGYSFMRVGTGGLNPSTLDADLHQFPNTFNIGSNFNGWSGEAQYNVGRWLGIVADVGGEYGNPFTARTSGVSGLPKMTEYSFLAGPVVSYRTKSRLTPYVHALFGWDRASLAASHITGTASPVNSSASSYTSFATVFVGGVDYKISRRFALRLAQVDYFRTTLDLNSLYGNAFGPGLFQGLPTHESNIRVSTGIAIWF